MCPECEPSPNPSDSWEDLLNHMASECFQRSRILQYKCQAFLQDSLANGKPPCTYQCESMPDLIQHYRVTHVNLLRYCALCSELFTDCYSWLKHLKKKHSHNRDNYLDANACVIFQNQCECCLESLDGQREVSQEYLQLHLVSSPHKHFSSKLVYKCSSCFNVFNTSHDLKLHREEPCDNIDPIEDAENLTNCTGLRPRPPRHEGKTSRMSEHPQNGLILRANREQRYETSVKNAEFLLGAWRNLVAQRYRRHHLLSLPHRASNNKRPPEIKHTCQHCHRKVGSDVVTRHERSCFYNTKRGCKTCFRSCSTKVVLLDHGYRHLQRGYKICLFCRNLPLGKDERLVDHIRRVHINEAKTYPFPCPICDKRVLNKNMLEVHFEHHHSPAMCAQKEVPVSSSGSTFKERVPFAEYFKCTKCDQNFTTLRRMKMHLQFEHLQLEKPQNLIDAKNQILRADLSDSTSVSSDTQISSSFLNHKVHRCGLSYAKSFESTERTQLVS